MMLELDVKASNGNERKNGFMMYWLRKRGKAVLNDAEPKDVFQYGNYPYRTNMNSANYIAPNAYTPQVLVTRALNSLDRGYKKTFKVTPPPPKRRKVLDRELEKRLDYYIEAQRVGQTLLEPEKALRDVMYSMYGKEPDRLLNLPLSGDLTDRAKDMFDKYDTMQRMMRMADGYVRGGFPQIPQWGRPPRRGGGGGNGGRGDGGDDDGGGQPPGDGGGESSAHIPPQPPRSSVNDYKPADEDADPVAAMEQRLGYNVHNESQLLDYLRVDLDEANISAILPAGEAHPSGLEEMKYDPNTGYYVPPPNEGYQPFPPHATRGGGGGGGRRGPRQYYYYPHLIGHNLEATGSMQDTNLSRRIAEEFGNPLGIGPPRVQDMQVGPNTMHPPYGYNYVIDGRPTVLADTPFGLRRGGIGTGVGEGHGGNARGSAELAPIVVDPTMSRANYDMLYQPLGNGADQQQQQLNEEGALQNPEDLPQFRYNDNNDVFSSGDNLGVSSSSNAQTETPPSSEKENNNNNLDANSAEYNLELVRASTHANTNTVAQQQESEAQSTALVPFTGGGESTANNYLFGYFASSNDAEVTQAMRVFADSMLGIAGPEYASYAIRFAPSIDTDTIHLFARYGPFYYVGGVNDAHPLPWSESVRQIFQLPANSTMNNSLASAGFSQASRAQLEEANRVDYRASPEFFARGINDNFVQALELPALEDANAAVGGGAAAAAGRGEWAFQNYVSRFASMADSYVGFVNYVQSAGSLSNVRSNSLHDPFRETDSENEITSFLITQTYYSREYTLDFRRLLVIQQQSYMQEQLVTVMDLMGVAAYASERAASGNTIGAIYGSTRDVLALVSEMRRRQENEQGFIEEISRSMRAGAPYVGSRYNDVLSSRFYRATFRDLLYSRVSSFALLARNAHHMQQLQRLLQANSGLRDMLQQVFASAIDQLNLDNNVRRFDSALRRSYYSRERAIEAGNSEEAKRERELMPPPPDRVVHDPVASANYYYIPADAANRSAAEQEQQVAYQQYYQQQQQQEEEEESAFAEPRYQEQYEQQQSSNDVSLAKSEELKSPRNILGMRRSGSEREQETRRLGRVYHLSRRTLDKLSIQYRQLLIQIANTQIENVVESHADAYYSFTDQINMTFPASMRDKFTQNEEVAMTMVDVVQGNEILLDTLRQDRLSEGVPQEESNQLFYQYQREMDDFTSYLTAYYLGRNEKQRANGNTYRAELSKLTKLFKKAMGMQTNNFLKGKTDYTKFEETVFEGARAQKTYEMFDAYVHEILDQVRPTSVPSIEHVGNLAQRTLPSFPESVRASIQGVINAQTNRQTPISGRRLLERYAFDIRQTIQFVERGMHRTFYADRANKME